MGPGRVTSKKEPKTPCWNTAVKMPNAAAMESRFITAAVSGTTSDLNTMASRMKDSSTTRPMKSGSF